MPGPKNAKSQPAKVNKSAWIRSQPGSMSAKDVVAAASKSGIKLTVAQVYTARSTAKKSKPAGKLGRPRKNAAVNVQGHGDFTSLRRAVFEHGFSKVESFLAELKKSVGL